MYLNDCREKWEEWKNGSVPAIETGMVSPAKNEGTEEDINSFTLDDDNFCSPEGPADFIETINRQK